MTNITRTRGLSGRARRGSGSNPLAILVLCGAGTVLVCGAVLLMRGMVTSDSCFNGDGPDIQQTITNGQLTAITVTNIAPACTDARLYVAATDDAGYRLLDERLYPVNDLDRSHGNTGQMLLTRPVPVDQVNGFDVYLKTW